MPRSRRLDVAKGIGIVLVVLGHNWLTLNAYPELYRLIFSFHMPLFFVISGVTLSKDRSIWQHIAKRSDSLLKPYFAVMAAYALITIGSAALGTGQSPGIARTLYMVASGIGIGTSVVPLWFLPHLALCSVLVVVALKCIGNSDRRLPPALMIVSFLAGVFAIRTMPNSFAGWPWSADLLPLTGAFVLAGYLAKRQIHEFQPDWRLVAAALATFLLLHLLLDETMDLYDRTYGEIWVTTAQALAGIYLALCLAAYADRSSAAAGILGYIGARAMFVLIFHIAIELKLFALLEPRGVPDAIAGGVTLAAGICIPLVLYEIAVRLRWARCILLPLPSGAAAPAKGPRRGAPPGRAAAEAAEGFRAPGQKWFGQ